MLPPSIHLWHHSIDSWLALAHVDVDDGQQHSISAPSDASLPMPPSLLHLHKAFLLDLKRISIPTVAASQCLSSSASRPRSCEISLLTLSWPCVNSLLVMNSQILGPMSVVLQLCNQSYICFSGVLQKANAMQLRFSLGKMTDTTDTEICLPNSLSFVNRNTRFSFN